MKQRIILGFFVIVALLGNAKAEECIPLPEIWRQSLEDCANELSFEQFRELFNDSTEDRAAKCFSVCLYSKIEYQLAIDFKQKFKDGQFSNEAIEIFIREHISHPFMERYLALSGQAAETANEVEGDECNRAHKFWLLNGEEELEILQNDIFCPIIFSQEFTERFKTDVHE